MLEWENRADPLRPEARIYDADGGDFFVIVQETSVGEWSWIVTRMSEDVQPIVEAHSVGHPTPEAAQKHVEKWLDGNTTAAP